MRNYFCDIGKPHMYYKLMKRSGICSLVVNVFLGVILMSLSEDFDVFPIGFIMAFLLYIVSGLLCLHSLIRSPIYELPEWKSYIETPKRDGKYLVRWEKTGFKEDGRFYHLQEIKCLEWTNAEGWKLDDGGVCKWCDISELTDIAKRVPV